MTNHTIYLTDKTLETIIAPLIADLPISIQITDTTFNNRHWQLTLTHKGLFFYPPCSSGFKPYPISFLQPNLQRRARSFGKKQPLAKALGNNHASKTIVDATAGLGRDAFVLAYQGYHLTLIEKHPLLVAALRYAIQEWQQTLSTPFNKTSWPCYHADSSQWLLQNNQAQIVYLDPMFPDKGKAALAKKEAQLLQQLNLASQDESQLLTCALQTARDRVVVKRPRQGVCIQHHRQLNYQVLAKAHRFDVYLTQ